MKIKVECRGEKIEMQVHPGSRLLDYLQSADIPVNAACGGAGNCSKCRVQVKEGFLAIGPTDRKAFSASELSAGWRLSCQALPKMGLHCLLPDIENLRAGPRLIFHSREEIQGPVYLACDLGSTGIVVSIGNERGEALLEAHLLNRQVRLGADIMSRLKVAQERGISLLQEKIIESLELCLQALEKERPEIYQKAASQGLYCSGNSALISFLHGWDISSLAVYPFQPLHLKSFESVSSRLGLSLKSLPLLGGFVGADTFAGILCVEEKKAEEPWMLVDIGTNTEIVLNNGRDNGGGELFFTSAPAGPAFEGANIVQGMRAEPGAICRAYYKNSKWDLECIGGDRARGICGSGLMDVLFESLQGGLLSKDGFLAQGKLPLTDEIQLVADDIREFQLAKSATRTAAEILIDRGGARPGKIFLSGTFAEHLRWEVLRGIGLLPEDIVLESLGNSSLKGSLLYAAASDEKRLSWMKSIQQRSRPVELALQEDFQDLFVKNLNFI